MGNCQFTPSIIQVVIVLLYSVVMENRSKADSSAIRTR